jgi:hypothetical protein
MLDAVLTDIGRSFLARNDGSFSIHKFAASDDEINYLIIKKYGRSIGRERIEKCTPIFEALTSGAQAQKYRLITASNQYLIKLPTLSLSSVQGTSSVSLGFGSGASRNVDVTIQQTVIDDIEIPVDLVDSTYMIELSNLFLQVSGHRPDNIDGTQRATYILNSTNENTQKGSIIQFNLALKSVTNSLFQVYGSTLNKSQINTYVRISGLVSGAVKEFAVTITK